MIIHQNFIGGNISVKEINGKVVKLENQLRDSTEDWFYWAFCVEGAEGKTLTFEFDENRLGYFGPAVSKDLEKWQWLGKVQGNSFEYHFKENENKVYFAHNLLYHPSRFFTFAKENNLKTQDLCIGYKGSPVPCVNFGSGEKSIILTARHHACESTGNYVLEGVLEELINYPLKKAKIFCVPFVDYEGVIRGDQGKNRAPHDHNRDYIENPIYPETRAIMEYAEKNGCRYAFDFHSPWHRGGINDKVFIVKNSLEKDEKLTLFGNFFEESITDKSLKYKSENDFPFMKDWNQPSAQFSIFMNRRPENEIAFSLETAYFGEAGNAVSTDNLKELGRCFAKALKKYDELA